MPTETVHKNPRVPQDDTAFIRSMQAVVETSDRLSDVALSLANEDVPGEAFAAALMPEITQDLPRQPDKRQDA